VTEAALVLARASIAHHSKSFSLASKLLPHRCRDSARVVYAWCRRADDAVDLAPPERLDGAALALMSELDAIYSGATMADPILNAFATVARELEIPEAYPRELLLGMKMDADGTRYETWDDLLLYCYRVAGTVGLMMCHILGVREASALRHAAHLGIAMQLTNIARDVAEDWQRGRLYLPNELLAASGADRLHRRLGQPLPQSALPALAQGVKALLAEAERYYRSADEGIPALDFQSAWAVATARAVYSDIGRALARQSFAVDAGRARVSAGRKLLLAAGEGMRVLGRFGLHLGFRPARLDAPLRFPDDIVPV
jgi:phytoene synthase